MVNLDGLKVIFSLALIGMLEFWPFFGTYSEKIA